MQRQGFGGVPNCSTTTIVATILTTIVDATIVIFSIIKMVHSHNFNSNVKLFQVSATAMQLQLWPHQPHLSTISNNINIKKHDETTTATTKPSLLIYRLMNPISSSNTSQISYPQPIPLKHNRIPNFLRSWPTQNFPFIKLHK